MMKGFTKTLLLVGTLAAGFNTIAGPLQRADVAANPVWLVHFDFDGLRSTAIGNYIEGEMNKPEAQARLAAFQALFSFDLRTQLHGVTLYSTGAAPEDGVLLVYADFDANRLVTLAKAAKDSQEKTYKNHVIYSWLDENKKHGHGNAARTHAAIQGARVIFGQREERLQQALDVLTGASANLASTRTFPQVGTVGSTSFIQAAARKMDFVSQSDPSAAVFRLAKGVRFDLNETQHQVSATLTLEGNDEEVATNIASIGQGLIALMKLQKEKPESVRFAEALSLKQDGAQVVASMTLPASEIVNLMKAGAARKAHKDAEKEKSGGQ
jgi:hypothetical protein